MRILAESIFSKYMKKCQIENSLFFNGSTDDSLPEQLKALYLKQEFSRFVFENQNTSNTDLIGAFEEFQNRVKPKDLSGPTWLPGCGVETVGKLPDHHFA